MRVNNKKERFKKDFGKPLIKIRESKGLNQRQFALKCFKEPQSIERVENGKSIPTIFYIHEITSALGISLEEFFRDFEPCSESSKEKETN